MTPLNGPIYASDSEERFRKLEADYEELKRLLQQALDTARRAQQDVGGYGGGGGAGGGGSGSYWATTDGSVPGMSDGGPGVGTGSVSVVDDSYQFVGVGSGLTLLNGWPGATEPDAWVRVLPTDLTDTDGNTVYDILGEDCPSSGGGS